MAMKPSLQGMEQSEPGTEAAFSHSQGSRGRPACTDSRRGHLIHRYQNRVPGAGRHGRLMNGRTTFVIAHRLSTIRNSDAIMVLDHGNIVERGDHASLIREKGIRADFILVKEGMTRINVKMRSDEESEINGQGPAISEADIKTLYEKLDRLSDGDVLVMAGSIPDVMPQTIYMDIMKYLADKDLKIVVDATKDLLVNVLQYHPFLIKPNNHELGEIFGVKITEKEDVITYAKKMQEKGAGNVLVSMAGDGAVLVR